MTMDFEPDQIAQREFGHTLRGYDPREVRSFLDEVAKRIAALEQQASELRSQLGSMDETELESRIDQTASEIANVLHTARVAAQSMHDRAADEAETLRLSARERIGNQLRSAEHDAYQLRKAAWETSTKMLDDVAREAAALRKQADKDALGIIGEAERNAHRKISDAKREVESRGRASRLESEKLLVEARAKRDEMLDEAERVTDAAQERVRALERRRDELMRELEAIRADTLSASKEESIAREEFSSNSVKLLPAEGSRSSSRRDDDFDDPPTVQSSQPRWADGSDTVRLIPASSGKPTVPDPELDHESLVEQLMDDTSERPRIVFPPEHPSGDLPPEAPADMDVPADAGEGAAEQGSADEGADPEDVVDGDASIDDDEQADAGDESDGGTDQAPGAAAEAEAPAVEQPPDPEPAPAPEIPPASPRGGDDLGTLFDLLRDPDTPAERGEHVSEDTAVEDLVSTPAPDPVELRDRALLPVMNRALRAVKRALSEIQNGEMERLKDDLGGFSSDPVALAALIDPELLILVREAHVAGVEAAVTLTKGGDIDRSSISRPSELDDPFAHDANQAVMAAVEEQRSAGSGVREASAAVSKIYRVWRSDEAERRVRQLAESYYQQGLAAGLAEVDSDELIVDLDALGI